MVLGLLPGKVYYYRLLQPLALPGTCTVKFYINGSLSTTTSSSEPPAPANTVDYRIGRNSYSSNYPDQFQGDIGVFLFYNRVLSTTEISDNYDLFKSRYGLT